MSQICVRLDGIPLAIELAAARAHALTAEDILAHLDDRFELLRGSPSALRRQQTLRATVDWSFALLSDPERILFRRLVVFAGGWELQAAERICGTAGVDQRQVLDLLSRLVAKLLVVADTRGRTVRYQLLETIRQYVREKLAAAGEVAMVGRRHRDWYLALAEEASRELVGGVQLPWLERLEREHDNLRGALEWCQADPGVERPGCGWLALSRGSGTGAVM